MYIFYSIHSAVFIIFFLPSNIDSFHRPENENRHDNERRNEFLFNHWERVLNAYNKAMMTRKITHLKDFRDVSGKNDKVKKWINWEAEIAQLINMQEQ